MKRSFTLLVLVMLVSSAFLSQAQLYPGLKGADTLNAYTAYKVLTPPTIDGDTTDAAWVSAPWKQAYNIINDLSSWPDPTTAVAPEGPFSGVDDINVKYKIIWDINHYYILFRYKDDKVIYADNHNGYRVGSIPSFATATTTDPALGGGDGTKFQAFRMDMFAYWLLPFTEGLAAGTKTINRASGAIMHNFFPGQLTKEPKVEGSLLWAPRHNGPTGATSAQNHVGTVAGKYDIVEDAYYIEFRDDTWATLFSNINVKDTSVRYYSAEKLPAIGDKLLLQGEINDADGITNRRDYQNMFTHRSGNSNTGWSQALVLTLGDVKTSVKTASLDNEFKIFPNPNSTNILNLNRTADVEIFNMAGQNVLKSLNSSKINIAGLKQGIYMVKDNKGNIRKMIRK